MSTSQVVQPEDSHIFSAAEEPDDKRPRERGVGDDEYGAEMDPNARVWKVYVEETDKADKELVEGWNSVLDVILIFAGLFSAVLTAFVMESSKDLRPDYSEISARTLLTISKTLLSPEAPPSDSSNDALQIDLPEFVPTRAAVMVNTLWFLSLGLSIAVTLVAILAKEWCYSFMTRRTGAKLTQGRLRQKRWDAIKRWKMEEMIFMLPLLMHISLLLFAVGLAVYLWNVNANVALPVVITTVLTVLYYTVTAFLPLFFKYCPYTTAVVKLFHPLWSMVFKSVYSKALFQILVMTPAWVLLLILDLRNRVLGKNSTHHGDDSPENDPETGSINSTSTAHGRVNKLEKKFLHRIEEMHKDFLVDSSGSGEDETPMDEATSAMLLWMITNCEEPKSVDLALKALAGADLWLPCRFFLSKDIDTQVLRKLEHCLYVLEGPHFRSHGSTWEELLDSAYLYSRALATLIRTRDNRTIGRSTVSLGEWEKHMARIHKISGIYLRDRSQAFYSTSFQFGTLLLEGSPAIHNSSFHKQQCAAQWQLIKQISTNEVTGLPPGPASVRALVNVMTRTLLYLPESPLPLVDLFNAYEITPGNEDATLGHAIGIALTVARFTNPRYEAVPVAPSLQTVSLPQETPTSLAFLSRSEHGQEIYDKLSTKQPTQRRTRALLTFGLLGLLDLPNDRLYHSQKDIQSIHKALRTLETVPVDSKDPKILTHEDRYLRYLGYHKLMPRTFPNFDLEQQFKTTFSNWIKFWVGPNSGPNSEHPTDLKPPSEAVVSMHLDALLTPSRCKIFGSEIVEDLVAIIFPPNERQTSANDRTPLKQPPVLPKDGLSLVAKKLCLRSIAFSVTDWPGCSRRQKQELKNTMSKLVGFNFHSKISSLIRNAPKERKWVPYAYRFLWNFAATLINNSHLWENNVLSGQDYSQVAGAIHPNPRTRVSEWKCVRDVGYEAEWFGLLQDLCTDRENAQAVLESEILDELTKDCEDKCYRSTDRLSVISNLELLRPSSPNDEHRGPGHTWPEVYQRLKIKCQAAIAQPVATNPLVEEQDIVETPISPTSVSVQPAVGTTTRRGAMNA